MSHARSLEPAIRGRSERGSADELIAALAARQYGVVSRAQLLGAGVDRHALAHRLDRRRLHVVHRGVYAAGHRTLTQEGGWMAAVLATGGVLSHRAAGALWRLAPSEYLETTSPSVRRRPGIRVHRSVLPLDEVTIERDIPTTIVARTLLDLATVLTRRQIERAVNEAEVRRLAGSLSLPDLLKRYRRRKGTPILKAVLEAGDGVTRSELEAVFLDLVAACDLTRPEVNAQVQAGGEWFECDCVWRPQSLIVELDGRAYHATAAAFERDRARDRRLQAAGWTVVRVTWRQLREEPETVVADLRALLHRDSASRAVL